MSDEPFALSTIPPALPAEGDYEALRAAVMHSARGRWFLEEYAKRNRQSDTLAVLSAIERIEAMIRGERNQQAYQTVRADLLEMAKTIAQTRAEVATASAATAPGQGAGSEGDRSTAAAPASPPDIFATAERMQEVAWTMRERGIDPATCAQIEALASSILSASSLRDPGDRRAQQLGEVLHYLERRIDTMLDHAAETAEAAQPPAPAPAPGADAEATGRDGEPEPQPAHSGTELDDAPHHVVGAQDEMPDPAPASVLAGDLPEQPSSDATTQEIDPPPVAEPEAPAAAALEIFLAHEDGRRAEASAISEPLETAPMDIEPLLAAPVENGAAADAGSGEETSHGALELEPLAVEPLFDRRGADPVKTDIAAELSVPAPEDQAAAPAQPLTVPGIPQQIATAPTAEAAAKAASPPPLAAPAEPPMPVSAMPLDGDAPAVAGDAKAEAERTAPPELFFPAVTFDTPPADSSIGSQMQSDLDALAAAPAERAPSAVKAATDPIAALDLPNVDVSSAQFEPSMSTAGQPPAAAPAAPVEPVREIDVLSNAWESAVAFPPAVTPPHAGTAAAPRAEYVPSMWEAPRAPSPTASQISEPDPADFLLEPLPISRANEPPQQPADPMREIEEELFAAAPMPVAAAVSMAAAPGAERPAAERPAAEMRAPQPAETPSEPAAPVATLAVPRPAAAPARPAARTMPRPALNDPLAALKAMSDEERIALFT